MIKKPVGKCYVNHELKKFWIEVPKNGSKTISHHIWSQGWVDGDFMNDDLEGYEPSIVLRDPLQRWLSGSLEISFQLYHYFNYDIKKFKERFYNFDFRNFEIRENIHLLKYTDLIGTLDKSNIKYFFLEDPEFETKIKEYYNIEDELYYVDRTDTNTRKEEIFSYIKNIYDEPGFVDKLNEFYKEDYELIQYAQSIVS